MFVPLSDAVLKCCFFNYNIFKTIITFLKVRFKRYRFLIMDELKEK